MAGTQYCRRRRRVVPGETLVPGTRPVVRLPGPLSVHLLCPPSVVVTGRRRDPRIVGHQKYEVPLPLVYPIIYGRFLTTHQSRRDQSRDMTVVYTDGRRSSEGTILEKG